MSSSKNILAYDFLRSLGKKNVVEHFGKIISNAEIKKSIFGNYAAAARNSIVISSSIAGFTSDGRNTKITQAEIGSFCSISWECTVNALSYSMHRLSTNAFPYVRGVGKFEAKSCQKQQRVNIGSDVCIGVPLIIMSGIKVDHGAVNGAGAIFTLDIDDYEIMVVCLAKHHKWRFEQEISKALLASQLRNRSEQKIQKNIEIFERTLTSENMECLLDD